MRWGVVSSLTLKKVFSWLKVDITYDEANIIYAEGGEATTHPPVRLYYFY
ncbi:hypothetical protein [Coxiella endosymbiont of Rhipicephalus microplus]|nr:hypothetical protein [Coxiella endosymbiont of Rhipicephalus microplus]